MSVDGSNGYEAVAGEFVSRRSAIGAATVREWAASLPRGGAVLDLGCGHGVPISQALIEDGFAVHGIDASPTLIAGFQARFPHAPAECNTVENSPFFGRRFDGVVAWGLMFLLSPDTQAALIRKVSRTLTPGGRFLFTSPREACEWSDNLTGRASVSLGSHAYQRLVEIEGLTLVGEGRDEGGNDYYFVAKTGGSAPRSAFPQSALTLSAFGIRP